MRPLHKHRALVSLTAVREFESLLRDLPAKLLRRRRIQELQLSTRRISMSDKLYRLFLTLLPKFRVDPERKGRCLGELVRRNVSEAFPQGGNTVLDDAKRWETNYRALEAIANSIDQKAFPRAHISSASGVPLETATGIVTDFNRNVLRTGNLEEALPKELKTERGESQSGSKKE